MNVNHFLSYCYRYRCRSLDSDLSQTVDTRIYSYLDLLFSYFPLLHYVYRIKNYRKKLILIVRLFVLQIVKVFSLRTSVLFGSCFALIIPFQTFNLAYGIHI